MWKCKKCNSNNIKGTTVVKCKLNIQTPKEEVFVGYKCDSPLVVSGDGVDSWECLDCGNSKTNIDLREWADWKVEE